MISQEVPKPFTVPEGYKAPSMGEQWLYATRRHPYYRYGYAAVALIGLGLYAVATISRVEDVHREARKPK
ncbi:hypothetical protein WJX81_002899 [Elliptochloris bilobata]|uniref:Deltamethrin resistance protein prag01 domain-containing protein n=1 Tax=Elliptochloris bilobata TaxID=381761 RepID=A0AAW1S1L5_9CHLO